MVLLGGGESGEWSHGGRHVLRRGISPFSLPGHHDVSNFALPSLVFYYDIHFNKAEKEAGISGLEL